MNCPYCEYESLSEQDLNLHILREHPEKTLTGEVLTKAMMDSMISSSAMARQNTLMQIALGLTALYHKEDKNLSISTILETYREFLRQVIKIGF